MRSFFNKALKWLNIGGRDWGIFFLSLLLAFSVWIIHKLSLEYNVYFTVDVVAESNIEGHSNISSSSTQIMAKCRTTGWRILYAYMTRDDVVRVKIPSTLFQQVEEEKYSIMTEKLHEYADKIFGSNVSVEYFVTDKVDFKFQKEFHKRVPIKAVSSLVFDDQYISTGPIELIPDSVTVYGDKMHLDALEYVTTSTIKKNEINEDFSGMISLTPISGMRYSESEVHYRMDVSRYLEVTKNRVPVTIEGVPNGKDFVADPMFVDLTMKVEFPLKASPDKDISLVVDYKDLKTSLSGLVSVRPTSLPLGTIKYEITPIAVHIREIK